MLTPTKLLSHASFGEMATLQMGSKTWVLLNSSRVVHEIIAKRGSITSERPHFPVASGLVSRGQRTVIQQTAQWTEGRRVMHHLLNNSSALKQYGKWIELESIDLLAAYLHKPHRWYSHHYRYSNSVIHRIVLGHRLLRSTPELNDFQRVGVQFIQSINSSIIDFFPQLAALPTFLKPWYKHWNNVGQSHYEVFQTWWKPVKQAVTNGTAPSSFVRDTLLHKDTRYSGNDEQAMYVAMSIIGAGSDNPRLAMNTFVMAALCYPSAFQKARNEIDCICDFADRLPTIDDIDRMPFICAMVKEVLRWRPVMPIIPQHQLTEDLEFEQYHFPSGTDFLINFAAICQEADNPGDFKPERWLGDGHERSIIQGLWQFGGGRRICVGYKVAQLELFLAFSRLIYCFDYTAVRTPDQIRTPADLCIQYRLVHTIVTTCSIMSLTRSLFRLPLRCEAQSMNN